MKPNKRVRRDPEEAKLLILETAERLILEEGYAAVTVRRVAKEAGVTSPLLHYYFPAADDLLVALYRHSSAKDFELLKAALDEPDPLAGLWSYLTGKRATALGVEFLALANHKKVVKDEIAAFATDARRLQAEALARAVGSPALGDLRFSPVAMAMLLTSVSRNLIMEGTVGISLGHGETRALIEQALSQCIERTKSRTDVVYCDETGKETS